MALTETQELVAALRKGKPHTFPNGAVVTRLNARKDPFERFRVELDGASEICCSFTKAAEIVAGRRGYLGRYQERRAALAAQDEDPSRHGYDDWARSLSDANLEVTLAQDEERYRERPQGTPEDPYRASSEFSDPAHQDADQDARRQALVEERERRDHLYDLSTRVRPSTLSRPSGLAERTREPVAL